MGEGIKVGGYNPIIIDGVEFKDTLKLSTKWQWVDDVRTLPVVPSRVVSHKNKIHLFSENNHYRIEGNEIVTDVSLPASLNTDAQLCSDDDFLYYINNEDCYRFDGNAFTKICTIPISLDSSIAKRNEETAVDKVNKRLYSIFSTKRKTSSKTYYEAICGYVDLQTLEWNSITTHPYPAGTHLFMLNGDLYSLGGYPYNTPSYGYTTSIYKFNGGSWTKILNTGLSDSNIIPLNNTMLFEHTNDNYIFDGASITRENEMPFKPGSGTVIKNNKELHSFGSIYYPISTTESADHGESKGHHQVLKKVLCLED